jgi:hypothetical protein
MKSPPPNLVQDCLVRALAKQHLWQEGTDLRAWLFTILHNQYVNQVRRAVREGAIVAVSETEPSLIRAADDEKRLELRDLDRALAQLTDNQRTIILMVCLEGMRYEAVAEIIGVPELPALVLIFGADNKTAGSASILISLGVVSVGLWRYWRADAIPLGRGARRITGAMAAGSIIGAILGGLAVAYAHVTFLKVLLGLRAAGRCRQDRPT